MEVPLFLNENPGERKALWRDLGSELNGAGAPEPCGQRRALADQRARSPFPAASKHEAVVVVASISDGAIRAAANACLMPIMARASRVWRRRSRPVPPALARGLGRAELAALLPAGAARNALDCALWDLEAKRSGRSAAALAGLPPLRPVLTAFTLSLGTPEAMAEAARKARGASPAQAQARRRGRRGAPARRARGGAAREAHRRCQRGVATA